MQWKLIRLRKEAGLTQLDAAKIAGISIDAYKNKETGKNQFKADEMFLLRNYFNKAIEDIFLPPNSIVNGIGEELEV